MEKITCSLFAFLLLAAAAAALFSAARTDVRTCHVPDALQLSYALPLLVLKSCQPQLFPQTPATPYAALLASARFCLPFLPLVLKTRALGGADWKFFLSFSYIYGFQQACRMLFTASTLFLLVIGSDLAATFLHSKAGVSTSIKGTSSSFTYHYNWPKKSVHPFFPQLAAAASSQLWTGLSLVFWQG